MILFTNGCSWTWGAGIKPEMSDNPNCERSDLVWPHHLGKLLNTDKVIDLSDPGGSNQRIVRTTYEWLKQQDSKTLKDTVAVIQLTDGSRIEFYKSFSQKKHENLPEQWVQGKWSYVGRHLDYRGNWQKDSKILLEKNHKILAETHPIEDVYRNITYLYALQGLFKSFKIKEWYFWNLKGKIGWDTNLLNENVNVVCSNFNILDKDAVWHYERISDKDPHPSILGHRQIASIIYEKISKK